MIDTPDLDYLFNFFLFIYIFYLNISMNFNEHK